MKDKIKNAVLVGIQLPEVSHEEMQASLQELTRLVTTLGYQVVGQVWQKQKSDQLASVLGEGKLKELADWTGGSGEVSTGFVKKMSKAAQKRHDLQQDQIVTEVDEEEKEKRADIVIVDTDLSPSQLRNLESAVSVSVLDRTGVIIEIFSRHARTRAARLQVEIARLTYLAPRLRETGGIQERQGGRGAGESSLELDRRRIRDRIKELNTELQGIDKEHHARRAKRDNNTSCVALVGYTNAGKSSLMRALTGSEILVADKLFATLDTTVRELYPEVRPKILISDTVGFIKKLPHSLVASFKSTLDEALNASLLLFVVDASDSAFRSQLAVTKEVLNEVGATGIPSMLVLNKQDRLTDEEKQSLKEEFGDAILLATNDPLDVKKMRGIIIDFFEKDMVEEKLFISYLKNGIIGDIRMSAKVIAEECDENGTYMTIKAFKEDLARIKKKL